MFYPGLRIRNSFSFVYLLVKPFFFLCAYFFFTTKMLKGISQRIHKGLDTILFF